MAGGAEGAGGVAFILYMGQTKRTPKGKTADDWKPRFLTALRETSNIRNSCERANVGRATFYEHRDSDEQFRHEVRQALNDACDKLEGEARRRAFEGLVRKKFDRGLPVMDPETGEQYVEREYSDTLLVFLLKAHRPKKFRDNIKHELTGADGQPLDFKNAKTKDLEAAYRVVSGAFGESEAATRNGTH